MIIGLPKQHSLVRLKVILAVCVIALMPGAPECFAQTGDGETPFLRFLQPTNGAVFSTSVEIPMVLHSFAPNDVFPTAEVFANEGRIATVSYCCTLCPCAFPFEGEELILQIPVPWDRDRPPSQTWQGWRTNQPGVYRLTARATGRNGTMVEATPVTITVVDATLHIFVQAEGTVTLTIPQGSLVPGGYDLEASQDLRTWTRLGEFSPGNVAAFYFDVPPNSARERRFYRSVYVPPRVP